MSLSDGTFIGPEQVAIIGMSIRAPGANNIGEFWNALENGVESIKQYSKQDLIAAGVDESRLEHPNYVPVGAVMPGADTFDADFFGINVREAEIMDPQHRVFLESAWEVLEDAGYPPERFEGSIGVFGGVAPNTYFQKNLATRESLLDTLGRYLVMLSSEKEYAVLRVSFKLDLRGPSISVNTACSTSGVAVHLACQSLLSGECDLALAGGARVFVPLNQGYLYEEGGILSPDGHCRAFDADARGTVIGSGVGLVALKRLSEAIRDGDNIHAVIKGSAINNDGSEKIGFTAPSVLGQSSAIEDALIMADIDPEDISYVEAHGTGTSLGDPIEIAALTKAYQKWTTKKQYCRIGSVKSNIGHLDAGAGAAGIIKTVLAMKHELIPPSLNYNQPNPQIDFQKSPFYVNSELSAWSKGDKPRRAGVSAFGLGGTNSHIIIEEAPQLQDSDNPKPWQLILLSAKTRSALDAMTTNLAQFLENTPQINLADAAYTLQVGRRNFDHRRILVSEDLPDTIKTLRAVDPKRVFTSHADPLDRDVVFMFSGQGSQYPGMGSDLYKTEPVFKETFDRCAEILEPILSLNLNNLVFPEDDELEHASQLLTQTKYTQPALFVIEYSLAQLWMAWGIHPRAMVGHSIGEYVAGCLSGVFSLEDALVLVAARGQLMHDLPSGAMLAVPLPEQELLPLINPSLEVAVVNNPNIITVAGQHEAIEALQKQLAGRDVHAQVLHTSHAFHSKMMEPILDSFTRVISEVDLHAPQIPFASNVTGTWITAEEAMDPNYWVKHIRQTVRFSDCLQSLFENPGQIFLEVGPGRSLCTITNQHPTKPDDIIVLASTRHPKESISDRAFMLNTLGRLWMSGMKLDWSKIHAQESRRRISLPTYPFERKRYWIDPIRQVSSPQDSWDDENIGATIPSSSEVRENQSVDQSLEINEGAPRSGDEQKIAEIWESLLGIKNISIYDNFYDLGGSSLLATRLFSQINEEFGTKLTPAAIFDAPTIEQLTSLLSQDTQAEVHTSLVRIQDGQGRPSLFCLPGNMGNVFTDLRYISRYVGKDQPIYGLQDGYEHPSNVESLAEHYLEDIRKLQPHGPYHLLGICSGGVLAYEMSQQLVKQGEEVAFLALVEPAALPLPNRRSYKDLFDEIWERFTRQVGERSSEVGRLSLNEIIVYVRLRWKVVRNLWSQTHYKLESFPGRFHLFLTNDSLTESPRPDWAKYAVDGAELHQIPGTHHSITGDNTEISEEAMKDLAHQLRTYVDEIIQEK